jgi:hypothetical protein
VKYLVSARGESQWVKNIRVDPNATLTTKSGTTRYVANTRRRRHLVPCPAVRGVVRIREQARGDPACTT